MKIYTDEFIQAVEKIEKIVEKRINTLGQELNRDSMIECKNISTGDVNEFGKRRIRIYTRPYQINVCDEIHSKKSVEEIGEAVAVKVEKEIKRLIEEKIEHSKISITNIGDVRKFIKVLLDQDVVFKLEGFNIEFRIGIEEYKR